MADSNDEPTEQTVLRTPVTGDRHVGHTSPFRLAIVIITTVLALTVLTRTHAPDRQMLQPDATSPIFRPNSDFLFIPSASVLLAVPARSARVPLLTWVFQGVVGQPHHTCANATVITKISSPCWHAAVLPASRLAPRLRAAVLTSATVLRVAVGRHPLERLLSAWRTELACPTDGRRRATGSAVRRRTRVQNILRQAGSPSNQTDCLTFVQFARALAGLQARVHSGRLPISEMEEVVRPARYFGEHLNYHLALTVDDLRNMSALSALKARLPFASLMDDLPPPWIPASGPSVPPAQVLAHAPALHRFARLSEALPLL